MEGMMFNHSSNRRTFPISSLLVALILVFVGSSTVHAILQNIKLSGGNISGGQVHNFMISPDGRFTVFRGDLRVDEKDELFSVPTLGGDRIRLSHNIPEECNVSQYFLSQDSAKVVYYVRDDTLWPNHCGLFVVPIQGGSQIELDAAEEGVDLQKIMISGDGQNVFFVFIPMPSDRPQVLYRVPIGGGARVAISGEIEGALSYDLTPDNAHIVFLEDLDTGPARLVRSDLNGTEALLANGMIHEFRLTPDGTHVIYSETTASGVELFSIPIGGGSPVPLNGLMVDGGNVSGFAITPDSRFVVYTADETVDEMTLLFQVPVDGSSDRIHLIPDMFAIPGRNVEEFLITPNSKGVVYMADFLMDERYDLFSVAIEGGTNYRLNTGMINTGDIKKFVITPNSLGVIIMMDYYTDGVDELFAVLIDGSWGVKLNDTPVESGDILDFVISPDSQGVVYLADQEYDDVRNLYAVPSTGGTAVKVHPDLIYGGEISYFFKITPDSRGVIYRADQELDEVFELFITYDFEQIYLPIIMK
jgi:hypothetical protein